MTKTKFKKGVSVAEVLPDTIKMVGKEMSLTTDAVEFNKYSLKDLDKVLDQIELDPDWEARLRKIIEDSK